jgi:hypothetical protein
MVNRMYINELPKNDLYQPYCTARSRTHVKMMLHGSFVCLSPPHPYVTTLWSDDAEPVV